jgi:hypothetical protein
VARRARLVPRRHPLHRRVLQGGDKTHLRQGRGAPDPARLFNSSLEGNVQRAIDIPEGGVVDEPAFKALVREAIALNGADKAKRGKKTKA